jgi:hypothetical protein
MTRSFFSAIALGFIGLALVPALLDGCAQTGVGDPCTPEQEYDVTFNGFAATEVNVESKSFQCQTRLCLVNHFQGRVSCPYGQKIGGTPPTCPPTSNTLCENKAGDAVIGACGIPGSKTDVATGAVTPTVDAVTGVAGNASVGALVQPQCTDRTATDAVYCSCRCANVDGNTNDGSNYCTCPDGFACTQLVTPIGPSDTGLTGAYCVKSGTAFNPINSCSGFCDPQQHNCG